MKLEKKNILILISIIALVIAGCFIYNRISSANRNTISNNTINNTTTNNNIETPEASNQKNQNAQNNNNEELESCSEHSDLNLDLVCDNCNHTLSFDDLATEKELKATTPFGKESLTVSGVIPENVKASISQLDKKEAVEVAKKHVKDLRDEDVLYAYDITLATKEAKYQPLRYKENVKVKLSNLNLDTTKTYAMLHIKQNNEKELLGVNVLNAKELEFNATSFSTYIVISVGSNTVTFNGENYKVFNTDDVEITDSAVIADGTSFTFNVKPNAGYAITNVSCVNAGGQNVITTSGSKSMKTVTINGVTEDLVVNVTSELTTNATGNDISSGAAVTLSSNEFVYTGNPHEPTATVKLGDETLTAGTDYIISYENNTNAGKAKAIITGTGSYRGTIEVEFIILDAMMEVTATGYTGDYDGKPHGFTLSGFGAVDSEIIYGTSEQVYSATEAPQYTDAGSYTVYYKVSKTNYRDFFGKVSIKINKIKVETVWGDTELIYNGTSQTPTATAVSPIEGETLTLSVSGGKTDSGTGYTATASIKSVTGGQAKPANYTLTNTTTTFSIGPKDPINFDVTFEGLDLKYNGLERKPRPIVKDGDVVLSYGNHYTLSYLNNIDAGEGTVNVTGIGSYDGSTGTATFNIGKRDIVVTPNAGQSKAYGDPEPELKYTYSGNVSDETPKFTGALSRANGEEKGNYIINLGSLAITDNEPFKTSNYNLVFSDTEVTFEISMYYLSESTTGLIIDLQQSTFEYDGNPQEPKADIKYNGVALVENVDYKLSYRNNTTLGTGTIIISGIGNYSGSISKTFNIVDTTKPSAPTIVAKLVNDDGENYVEGNYTGKNINLIMTSTDIGGIETYEWSQQSDSGFTSEGLGIANGSCRVRFAEEMNKTFYFRAKDKSGNYGDVSSFTVKIDKTAPKGSISIDGIYEEDGKKFTNKNGVTINVEATDNISDSSKIKVAFINEVDFDLSKPNANINWLDYETTKSWNISNIDGLKTVYVLFKDEAGNQSVYLAL